MSNTEDHWQNSRQTAQERDMVLDLNNDKTNQLRKMLDQAISNSAFDRLSSAVNLCGGNARREDLSRSVFFYKYMTMSELGPHYDVRPKGDPTHGRKFASVIYYFNHNYGGGEFQAYDQSITFEDGVVDYGAVIDYDLWVSRVRPRAGDAIIISNDLLHSVNVVSSGNKYIGVMHCV